MQALVGCRVVAIGILWLGLVVGNELGAQVGLFQTRSGVAMQLSVEERQVYRALYSLDLQEWEPIGDPFLPSPRVPWVFPKGDLGFLRLDPAYHLDEDTFRVVIVGDSTVADLSGLSIQLHGWGQVLSDFFQPEVLLSNQAGPAVGTVRFLETNRIELAKRVRPHVMLMQFGHIDDDREVAEADFEANLRAIIASVREINAIPVLVTPAARRIFGASGDLDNLLADRRESVLEVAGEERVATVDLNGRSAALFNQFGHDATTFITACGAQCDDQSHFSRVGSYLMAGLAADAFPPILQAVRVPLSEVMPSVVAAFENDRKFESLSKPFVELTGFEDEQFWEFVFWDEPPILP